MESFDYEEIWKTRWGDVQNYGPFHRHLRRLIKKMIRPLKFQSILDIGCGQGSLLAELRLEFPHIKTSGVDVSASAVELARRRVPGGDFQVLDIATASLSVKYDLAVCSEVLEHVPDDVTAIQNLRKMTKEYLLVSTPQGQMRDFEKQIGHVRNYARGELVNKIKSSGFTVVSVVEWGFPFYSPLYRNFLDLTGGKGTTGEFGPFRKLLGKAVYLLFSLNSSKRGDEIIVLAKANQNSTIV
jgi:2-polyprenyl-3-methyl-5-hydroxy-6-metoxy-1,4-benzoquinol methylase